MSFLVISILRSPNYSYLEVALEKTGISPSNALLHYWKLPVHQTQKG